MGFRKGNYASVWDVKPIANNRTSVRLSTSRKDKESGKYEQDFSGYVMFVGTATASKAAKLRKRDRIQLGEIEVTTKYSRDENKEYVNYTCFDFESANRSDGDSAPGGNAPADTDNDAKKDDPPF